MANRGKHAEAALAAVNAENHAWANIDLLEKQKHSVKTAMLELKQQMNEKLEEARRTFLDRMAAVSSTLINQEHDALVLNNGTFFMIT